MRKKLKSIIVFSVLLLVTFIVFPTSGIAQGGTVNGGEVSTKGKITFYEESESSDSSQASSSSSDSESSSSSSTEESTISSSLPSTGGKLPQTGEMVRNVSAVAGGVLLLIVAILFYRKRKKEENHES